MVYYLFQQLDSVPSLRVMVKEISSDQTGHPCAYHGHCLLGAIFPHIELQVEKRTEEKRR